MSRGWLAPALFCLPWLFSAMMVATDAQRVDCRKFVFAPLCRGVAAKRAYMGEEEFYLENDGKVNGLGGGSGGLGSGGLGSGGLGSYPTVPPAAKELGDAGTERGHNKEHAARANRQQLYLAQAQPWKSRDEQALKADTLYDWYLDNRKRSREPEIAYDY